MEYMKASFRIRIKRWQHLSQHWRSLCGNQMSQLQTSLINSSLSNTFPFPPPTMQPGLACTPIRTPTQTPYQWLCDFQYFNPFLEIRNVVLLKKKKASLESQWLYCILSLWNSHQQAVRWVQSKQGLKIVLCSWCSQQTSIVPNIIGIEMLRTNDWVLIR